MRGRAPLATPRLDDPTAERARRGIEQAVRALQAMPTSSLRVVKDVELVSGVDTPVPHGLGRVPIWVKESCVRNATSTGRVVEIRSGSSDRSQYVVLRATGWGATITVDVLCL